MKLLGQLIGIGGGTEGGSSMTTRDAGVNCRVGRKIDVAPVTLSARMSRYPRWATERAHSTALQFQPWYQ